jgi:hypothetical protein
MEKSAGADYFDGLGTEDGEQIEEMLGVAFVACQSFVGRLLFRLRQLDEACKAEFGQQLPSQTANLQNALKKGFETFRVSNNRRRGSLFPC